MIQGTTAGQAVYRQDKDTKVPDNNQDQQPKPYSGLGVPGYSPSDAFTLENFHTRYTDIESGKFALGIYVFKAKVSQNEVRVNLDGISFVATKELLKLLGYRLRRTGLNYEFIRVDGNIMDRVTDDIIKGDVIRFAESETGPLTVEYMGSKTTFGRTTLLEVLHRYTNSILNKSYYETLPPYELPLMRDTRDKAYFLYGNGIVEVMAGRVSLKPYSDVNGFSIWKSHINEHHFKWIPPTPDNCQFMKFINNLTAGDEARRQALCSAIGYLIHNYNHSAIGKAVMLYDEKPTRKGSGNGGTGKGIICQALGKMREMAIVDGKSYDGNNRFRNQGLNVTTQILGIDDARSDMEFPLLYSMITEGAEIEKKNQQIIKISAKESPKIVITSNNIIGGSGTSDIRRQFIIELSDYYSSKIKSGGISPVEQEHGILFDGDTWSTDEWNAFYSFMIQCAQLYLSKGLISYEFKNITHNKILQHCGEDFTTWIYQQDFTPGREYVLGDLFDDYRSTYYGDGSTKFSLKTFGNHLRFFGDANGWELDRRRSNHVNYFRYLTASNREMNNKVAESGCNEMPF